MAYPRKKKRNEKIVALRQEDPKKYTFTYLAEKFGIARNTVCEIYHREIQRALINN